jgi:hypothetical protein
MVEETTMKKVFLLCAMLLSCAETRASIPRAPTNMSVRADRYCFAYTNNQTGKTRLYCAGTVNSCHESISTFEMDMPRYSVVQNCAPYHLTPGGEPRVINLQ